MPTKQITVCVSCGKVTCDGSLWNWVQVNGFPDALSSIPEENRVNCCTLSFGLRQRKHLLGKKVGDQVSLYFPNWVKPATLTVEKVSD